MTVGYASAKEMQLGMHACVCASPEEGEPRRRLTLGGFWFARQGFRSRGRDPVAF